MADAALDADRTWLLNTAIEVAEKLKHRSKGTRLRIRLPHATKRTYTDGWSAVIGDLGKTGPKLHVWLDRWSGHGDRKFYAGFFSWKRRQITNITKRVEKGLFPVRVITASDYHDRKVLVLKEPLTKSEFSKPLLEKLESGETYFGIYGSTPKAGPEIDPRFCILAAAFIEDVARALPNAKQRDERHDVFPQEENRKVVTSHLRRERSRLLATECKIRDKYTCQVCGFRFGNIYGKLGDGFAEAHHKVPLSKLKEGVTTRLEDLITVCANCHRMLHRMEGKQDDFKKLKKLVSQQKG